MGRLCRLLFFAVLIVILGLTTIGMAHFDFQADVEQCQEIEVRQGRIWAKDDMYRLEMAQPGGPDLYIIVGAKPGMTQVVFPDYKAYVEVFSDGIMSRMNDPFQAAMQSAKQYAVKNEGQETFQGMNCDRQLIHHQGTGVMRLWVATKLEFPIKIEQLTQEKYILLKNIEVVEVPKKYFQIPAGFTAKSEEQIRQLIETDPEVAAKVAAYEKNRPRKAALRGLFAEGDTWKIVLSPDTKWRIKVKPFGGSGGASWFAVPYQGRAALKEIGASTYSGEHQLKGDSASGVNGLSIGAVQGEMSVTVTLIGTPPQVQAIQKVYTKKMGEGSSWNAHRGYRQYRVRLYALSKPAAGVRFTAAGKQHELKIPAGQYEEFSFSDQDKLDNLDIMMEFGEIKVVCREEFGTADVSHILLDEPFSGNHPEKAMPAAAPSGAAASTSKIGSAVRADTPAATSTARGENDSRMVLVLDASGSMWGQIDGTAKMEIAKQVMIELIDQIPADVQTGLTVYGHRRKGDCKDIEILMPVGKHDAAAMKTKVASISPKGKTPIAQSLIQVADTLKERTGQNTIILITDGIESCDHDPCKVAKELAAAGVVAKIHVVGFDLTSEAMHQLKCITEPSGGLLVAAKNADELKAALNEVVTATLTHNLVVKGLDANHKPLFVSVTVFDKQERSAAEKSGSMLRFSLPAGRYNVEVRCATLDQTIVLKNVAVEENRLTEKEAVFAQGALKIKSLDNHKKATYSSAAVYEAGTQKEIKHHNGAEHLFTLPPGTYDIRISHSPTKMSQWIRGVELAAGEQLEEEVVFAQSKLMIETLDGNQKALYSSAEVYSAGTSEKIKRSTGSKHTFTLLPGPYDVKVSCSPIKEDQWLRNIVLGGGEQVERRVQFALGKIKVNASGPDGKKLYLGVEVYTAGGDEQIDRATGGGPTFTLKPGVYDIKVRAGEIKSEKWLRGITIENGASLEQRVQF